MTHREKVAIEEPAKTRRTKDQLLNDLEESRAKVEELTKDLERYEKYKAYFDCAAEVRVVYDSFIDAGFNETQATQLLIACINNASNAFGSKR